jgi:hypothetical protein
MDTQKQHTFMSACRDYFGLKEGQTSMQFGKEVQALTPEDRTEITAGLTKLGYQFSASVPA